MDLGADSLDLNNIASDLGDSLHSRIHPTIFFGSPDINSLTDTLHGMTMECNDADSALEKNIKMDGSPSTKFAIFVLVE